MVYVLPKNFTFEAEHCTTANRHICTSFATATTTTRSTPERLPRGNIPRNTEEEGGAATKLLPITGTAP